MIKKICIISSHYPSASDPVYSFVGGLVEQFADLGIECTVISPVSFIEKKHKAKTRIEITKKGNQIKVYCPKYFVFPDRTIGSFKTYKLTVKLLEKVVLRTYQKHVKTCDAVYAHFIPSGVNAAWLKKKVNVSAFLAVGESNIRSKELSYTISRDLIYEGLNGVIAVSTPLKEELRNLDIISSSTPVCVVPNAIDLDIFYPRDKRECRKKLSVDDDAYIISFVGSYTQRKGFDKIQTILKKHPDWNCILIGAGEIPITVNDKQVLFSGKASHEDIPDIISASDVFVLPTKAEGCCNAIIEALGCGIPVVSSDLDFNYDLLDETCSIKVDPENVDEIEQALMQLNENLALKERLAKGAVVKGKKYSIKDRAQKILSFMEKNL